MKKQKRKNKPSLESNANEIRVSFPFTVIDTFPNGTASKTQNSSACIAIFQTHRKQSGLSEGPELTKLLFKTVRKNVTELVKRDDQLLNESRIDMNRIDPGMVSPSDLSGIPEPEGHIDEVEV